MPKATPLETYWSRFAEAHLSEEEYQSGMYFYLPVIKAIPIEQKMTWARMETRGKTLEGFDFVDELAEKGYKFYAGAGEEGEAAAYAAAREIYEYLKGQEVSEYEYGVPEGTTPKTKPATDLVFTTDTGVVYEDVTGEMLRHEMGTGETFLKEEFVEKAEEAAPTTLWSEAFGEKALEAGYSEEFVEKATSVPITQELVSELKEETAKAKIASGLTDIPTEQLVVTGVTPMHERLPSGLQGKGFGWIGLLAVAGIAIYALTKVKI